MQAAIGVLLILVTHLHVAVVFLPLHMDILFIYFKALYCV